VWEILIRSIRQSNWENVSKSTANYRTPRYYLTRTRETGGHFPPPFPASLGKISSHSGLQYRSMVRKIPIHPPIGSKCSKSCHLFQITATKRQSSSGLCFNHGEVQLSPWSWRSKNFRNFRRGQNGNSNPKIGLSLEQSIQNCPIPSTVFRIKIPSAL